MATQDKRSRVAALLLLAELGEEAEEDEDSQRIKRTPLDSTEKKEGLFPPGKRQNKVSNLQSLSIFKPLYSSSVDFGKPLSLD